MIFSRAGQLDGQEQWAPVSDLMAALMLIFMFVAVVFIRSVVGDEQDCDRIYGALESEFGEKFDTWNAALIAEERGILTIQFVNRRDEGPPLVMFERGQATIGEPHKSILMEFFPAYMRVIQELEDQNLGNDVLIQEIRIEGHTSSEGLGGHTELEAYLYNMKLSQRRAREVLRFVLEEVDDRDSYMELAMSRVTANGLSSSRTLPPGGVEDRELSRRVEFRTLSAACQRARYGG